MTSLEGFKLDELQSEIAKAGAQWEVGETPFTQMSSEERSLLLGYVPGPGQPTLAEREQIAAANLAAFMATPGAVAAAPGSYDLRNVNGQNFITSVKDQGGCGSCVAFGVAATAEGRFRRQRNNPNLSIDFSEAHLFYCHARSEGRRCGGSSGGWWPSNALNAFRDKGVVDEACYPYSAGDQDCTNLCSDWKNRLTKITGWTHHTSIAAMKEYISKHGPLTACYTVYEDFFAYRGGIYRHVTGAAKGGHCVSCVGYDDAGGYWICKNSWGPRFGEDGYFRIAYGQCGIDSSMDAVNGIEETGWERNTRIIGLWANNQDRNAYAFVQNMGWRRISADNDNIFLNMLAQLITAKTDNRRVDFYQEKAVINQVYIL